MILYLLTIKRRYNTIFNAQFHHNSYFILIPLILLGAGSILFGFVLFGELNNPVKPIIVSNLIKQTPILIALLVILLSIFNKLKKIPLGSGFTKTFIKMFVNSFYFNEIVAKSNVYLGKFSFLYTYRLIDSQVLEWATTTTLTSFLRNTSSKETVYNHHNIKAVVRFLIVSILLLYFSFI